MGAGTDSTGQVRFPGSLSRSGGGGAASDSLSLHEGDPEAAKPRAGLLDACDMIFCLDWACTDTRMGSSRAGGKDGSVVFKRKALNWLVEPGKGRLGPCAGDARRYAQ
ncbi:MAG: DUF4272 domain-containing protein [Roseburia sp.]